MESRGLFSGLTSSSSKFVVGILFTWKEEKSRIQAPLRVFSHKFKLVLIAITFFFCILFQNSWRRAKRYVYSILLPPGSIFETLWWDEQISVGCRMLTHTFLFVYTLTFTCYQLFHSNLYDVPPDACRILAKSHLISKRVCWLFSVSAIILIF